MKIAAAHDQVTMRLTLAEAGRLISRLAAGMSAQLPSEKGAFAAVQQMPVTIMVDGQPRKGTLYVQVVPADDSQ